MHQPVLFREGQRAEDDKAIPPSKNPGITPSQALDADLAKTRGTGKLKDLPPPKIVAPAAEAAAPTLAPAEAPKKEAAALV